MRDLLIATTNLGKIKEIKEILQDIPYQLKSLEDLGIDIAIEEKGITFAENAILKARTAGEKTGLQTVAEDSGLEVDVLDGRPGIYSARYKKGSDSDRINKLLKELDLVPKEKRTARFKAVAALYDPNSEEIHTFEGVSEGYITEKPLGKNGFGYDPIFFNFDLGKTNGEADQEEKNRVSHRARALEKCKAVLLTYKIS